MPLGLLPRDVPSFIALACQGPPDDWKKLFGNPKSTSLSAAFFLTAKF